MHSASTPTITDCVHPACRCPYSFNSLRAIRSFTSFRSLLFLSLLSLASLLPLSATAQTQPPNILVILTDDQQYRAIGYNNPAVQTPNLDRLAREGIIFDHAYIASPICMASRASLMTGLFPQQHGAVGLDTASFVKNIVQEKRYPTLPRLLAPAGYETAFCGKSHLGPPMDYGFAQGEEIKEWNDDKIFDYANNFLAKRAPDAPPFLLWVATHQPHLPLLPDPEWIARYADTAISLDPNFRESPLPGSIYNQGLPGEQYYRDSDYTKNYKNVPGGPPRSTETMQTFIQAYYAIITRLDTQVGRLVETLRARGLDKNTVILFLSDNGYLLGNHGLGNKITMLEESVRVPMFVWGPRVASPGSRNDSLVSSVDVLPTLLDLAGVPLPGHLSGKSLVPLLEGTRANVREAVPSECVGVGGTVGQGHRMVRTVQWKYVLTDTNEEYLFDELADPFERKNVAAHAENQQVLSEMRAHLWEWMDQIQDLHPRPPQ